MVTDFTDGEKKNIGNLSSLNFTEKQLEMIRQHEAETEKQRKEQERLFTKWTQYSKEHASELISLAIDYPKAHAILIFLVDHMAEYNAVMCSYQALMEVLCISKATVQRNLQVLKDNGFITILKSGTSNVYAINDQPFWKSWGDKLNFAKFPANVILSLSEQEESYQERSKAANKAKRK